MISGFSDYIGNRFYDFDKIWRRQAAVAKTCMRGGRFLLICRLQAAKVHNLHHIAQCPAFFLRQHARHDAPRNKQRIRRFFFRFLGCERRDKGKPRSFVRVYDDDRAALADFRPYICRKPAGGMFCIPVDIANCVRGGRGASLEITNKNLTAFHESRRRQNSHIKSNFRPRAKRGR